jgi:hypothetical protein
MHTDVSEFDPVDYYQEFGNTITSDNIRSLGWVMLVPECKRKIHDHLLPKPEITTVALLLGGPGSGKSTLVQHLPEWRDRGTYSPIAVDDNAGEILESPGYLENISYYGKKAEIYWVSCSLKEALERAIERYEKNNLEGIRSLDKFSSEHFKDQNCFITFYNKHKNNPDVSFTLLLNPKSSAEQGSQAGPSGISIDGIQRFEGQDAYDYITHKSRNKPKPEIEKEAFEALIALCRARQKQGRPINRALCDKLFWGKQSIPRANLEQTAVPDHGVVSVVPDEGRAASGQEIAHERGLGENASRERGRYVFGQARDTLVNTGRQLISCCQSPGR